MSTQLACPFARLEVLRLLGELTVWIVSNGDTEQHDYFIILCCIFRYCVPKELTDPA